MFALLRPTARSKLGSVPVRCGRKTYCTTSTQETLTESFAKDPTNPKVAIALIKKLADKRDVFGCFNVYGKFTENATPDSFLMGTLLNACLLQGKGFSKALKLVWSSLQNNPEIVPDVYLLTQLLSTQAKSRAIPRLGEEIFNRYLKNPAPGLVVDGRLCSALIRSFASFEEVPLVEMVFEWIEDNSATSKVDLFADPYVFTGLFYFCSNTRATDLGRRVQRRLEKSNALRSKHKKSLVYLFTSLMNMLGRCGASIEEVMSVYEMMEKLRVAPSAVTFITLFNTCVATDSPKYAKEVYSQFLGSPLRDTDDTNLNNALLRMFGKFYGLEATLALFHDMKDAGRNFDVATWTQMLVLCKMEGNIETAITLVNEMINNGIELDEYAWLQILETCARAGSQEYAYKIYQIFQNSVFGQKLNSPAVVQALINMFGRCENIDSAIAMFREMKQAGRKMEISIWNVLFRLCQDDLNTEKAKEIFDIMVGDNARPTVTAYIILLELCASTGDITFGKRIQEHIALHDVMHFKRTDLVNLLLNMYAKCDSVEAAHALLLELKGKKILNIESWNILLEHCAFPSMARRIFKEIQVHGLRPTVNSWNYLLAAHAHESSLESLKIFNNMLQRGVTPNKQTFTTLIANCTRTATKKHADYIRQQLTLGKQFDTDPDIVSLLSTMYENCKGQSE